MRKKQIKIKVNQDRGKDALGKEVQRDVTHNNKAVGMEIFTEYRPFKC